jgi:hypothetical protein
VTAHTAAGKLQGLGEDAFWYEAAQLVGITNALNVVADAFAPSGSEGITLGEVADSDVTPGVADVFAEIREFYGGAGEVPRPFRLIGHDPAYLADVWAATRRAFHDNRLGRRLKTALAFAVSVTSRSTFGAAFHLGEMRRLGVGPRGVMEILGVTQMFSSYTKIADTLQLEPDMGGIAPVDLTPAPGGD